ncbi:MAG: DUF4105 domain-containing protein [Bdellovibrionales bacterium]|nr:DUF4105 domain-containing protein [Bdellovibrionales bacterium]
MRSLLLILFLFVFSPLVHAKVAYWGIVGIGRGNGVLGHSFLLVKERNQPFLIGDVYQYNISAKDGKALSPADVMANTGNLIFSLKQQKFLQIFNYYTSAENRIVALYELDMNEREVNDLASLLQADMADLKFPENHQYGLYNNCVTRPVELINRIVDGRRRIDYLGSNNASVREGSGILASIRGSILNRLPFFIANTLENHPISKGRVQLYESRTTRTARFFSSIKSDITKMGGECRWSRQTRDALEMYTILFLTEPNRYLLDPVIKLVNSCSAAQSVFAGTVLKLYQVMDDKYEAEKQKLYEIANQLGQK